VTCSPDTQTGDETYKQRSGGASKEVAEIEATMPDPLPSGVTSHGRKG
jgi:hypothetical protein